jgi:hypothetical protein
MNPKLISARRCILPVDLISRNEIRANTCRGVWLRLLRTGYRACKRDEENEYQATQGAPPGENFLGILRSEERRVNANGGQRMFG